MCTLFIYRKKNTKWPVLIATNRDEFFKRKFFSPNKHWSSNIDIFAGKDTLKGGSWLGINKSHLCAVVLNRDSNSIQLKETKSRGNLVLNILKKKSTKEAVDFIAKQKFNKYKYFNLLFFDYEDACWVKYNHEGVSINKVPYGFSIIDNYDLNDTKSKKQNLYKKIFKKNKIPNPDKNDFKSWEKCYLLIKHLKIIKILQYLLIILIKTMEQSAHL